VVRALARSASGFAGAMSSPRQVRDALCARVQGGMVDSESDSPELERASVRARSGTPPARNPASESHPGARLSIINDSTASAGDRLRAMEQLESRGLGKPKETVEHQDGKSEADRMLDRMSTEELEELVQRGRHLRAVNEEAAAADEPARARD
jgi:hypothetical protein